MAKKPIEGTIIQVDLNFERLREKYSAKAIDRAGKVSIKRAGADLLARVREAYAAGGADPRTGATGFWPERVVPDGVQEAQIKAAARVIKKAAKKNQIAKQADIDKARKNAVKKFKAKTKEGVVSKIRSGGPILVGSGRAFDSINLSKPTSTASGFEISVGSNVPYLRFHEQPGNKTGFIEYEATGKQAAFLRQLGFSRVFKGAKIRLPQRRIFILPKKWAKGVTEVFVREFFNELETS